MKRFLCYYLLPLVLLFWGSTAFYSVDYSEFAYVTRFGQPVVIHDGATDAGLHAKLPWPIDSVLRIDRRLQSFDLPAAESLTADQEKKGVEATLTVDAFVSWRIPDSVAADRFIRTVGTPERAKRVLQPQISGQLASLVSDMPFSDLVAVAEEKRIDERSEKLHRRLLGEDHNPPGERPRESIRQKMLEEYGIEIVDLRVRRFSYPESNRASTAERIRSERARKVADYESLGRKKAADILSAAEKEARTMEAEARAKKQTVEGQADVEADKIRNEAHAQDREFYAFLQKLKSYQLLLSDTRDVLLLSTKHPLFDLLLNPPKSADLPGKAPLKP